MSCHKKTKETSIRWFQAKKKVRKRMSLSFNRVGIGLLLRENPAVCSQKPVNMEFAQ
jgi:hypothetical protein